MDTLLFVIDLYTARFDSRLQNYPMTVSSSALRPTQTADVLIKEHTHTHTLIQAH